MLALVLAQLAAVPHGELAAWSSPCFGPEAKRAQESLSKSPSRPISLPGVPRRCGAKPLLRMRRGAGSRACAVLYFAAVWLGLLQGKAVAAAANDALAQRLELRGDCDCLVAATMSFHSLLDS